MSLGGVVDGEVVGGVGFEVEEFDGMDVEVIFRDFDVHASGGKVGLLVFTAIGEQGVAGVLGVPLDGDGGGGIVKVGEIEGGGLLGGEGRDEKEEKKKSAAHVFLYLGSRL